MALEVPAPAGGRDRRQHRPQRSEPQKDGGRRRRPRQAGGDAPSPSCAPLAARRALVECRLATGRTHQIRVHLADRGHPLIGDRFDGARRRGRAVGRGSEQGARIAAFPRQALHAARLGFDHPAGITGHLVFDMTRCRPTSRRARRLFRRTLNCDKRPLYRNHVELRPALGDRATGRRRYIPHEHPNTDNGAQTVNGPSVTIRLL